MREFDEAPREEERPANQEHEEETVFRQPAQAPDTPPSDNTAPDRSGGELFADGAAPAGTAASSPDNIAQEPTGSDAFSGEKPETPSAAGTDGWQPAGHVTTAAGPADAAQPTGTAYNPAAGQPPYGYGAGGYSPAGGQGYGPYGPGYGGQTPYPPQGGAYGEQGASYTPGSGYTTAQPYQVNQTPPPIQIQKVEPQKSEPTPNKGLRVFLCIRLVFFILLNRLTYGNITRVDGELYRTRRIQIGQPVKTGVLLLLRGQRQQANHNRIRVRTGRIVIKSRLHMRRDFREIQVSLVAARTDISTGTALHHVVNGLVPILPAIAAVVDSHDFLLVDPLARAFKRFHKFR